MTPATDASTPVLGDWALCSMALKCLRTIRADERGNLSDNLGLHRFSPEGNSRNCYRDDEQGCQGHHCVVSQPGPQVSRIVLPPLFVAFR